MWKVKDTTAGQELRCQVSCAVSGAGCQVSVLRFQVPNFGLPLEQHDYVPQWHSTTRTSTIEFFQVSEVVGGDIGQHEDPGVVRHVHEDSGGNGFFQRSNHG